MDLQEAVKQRILELCKQKNISINKLATLTGVRQSTINNLIDGTSKTPTLLTILRICLGLNIQLEDFFILKIVSISNFPFLLSSLILIACEYDGVQSSLSIVSSKSFCSCFFKYEISIAGDIAILLLSTNCNNSGISSVSLIYL